MGYYTLDRFKFFCSDHDHCNHPPSVAATLINIQHGHGMPVCTAGFWYLCTKGLEIEGFCGLISVMFKNVTIIGDGAMGSVCAILLCEKGIAARMWGYDATQLAEMAAAKENKKFLPGYTLPGTLVFNADDATVFDGTDMIVSAVPCQFVRGVWGRLKKYVPAGVPIVSVAKGIENKTLLRPTEVLAEVLGAHTACAALSGPTIADELARKLPATALAASVDEKLAQKVQRTFNIGWLRVYTNTDIVGVELAGAMKNVIAIAAGIVD
ncbi:MAG: hypothetical protein Q7T18_01375, partial [Sedimentisphaerales bacterium]|nr:hypothetical protein [Sedimentisphaerales bacterium]